MTSSSRGSKIPASQQSYGRKVLATLEKRRNNLFVPQKNILHNHGSFSFFWPQEKLKTMVMQNLGGGGGWGGGQKDHYGIF